MQREGFRPDGVTYACILKACGVIGSLEIGEDIDAEVRRKGLLNKDVLVGNSLIDMYVKCGMLQKAEETFVKLPVQDVISWTSLMVGHAQLGNANAVLDLFTKMRKQGIAPNLVTFLVLLSACSHAGLLEEGESLFNDMHEQYSLTPNLEHYARMIDLYGRAGHFDKAQDLLDKVAPSGNLPLFLGILATCLKWVNVKLGRWAFEQCIQLDEKCTAAYVSMEKLYAMAGMQTEANEIESQRVKSKAPKIAGCCWWTDVARNVHSFVGDDESHPRITDITAKLSAIQWKLSQMGYSPSLHWPSQTRSDYVKENILCGQSEKLAVACGLVYTPNGTSLRVTKNMKICGSCHAAISLMSIIENRKIQVNAANCVHIFEDGRCHCDEHYLI
jgi:pentatricopeptide repeat protein